jgi:hypothetical protein
MSAMVPVLLSSFGAPLVEFEFEEELGLIDIQCGLEYERGAGFGNIIEARRIQRIPEHGRVHMSDTIILRDGH